MYLDPSHTPRPMEKRELARQLRELASKLEADADNVGVCVAASQYHTPGVVRRVNVATRTDWEQGNKDVWLEDGCGPSRTTWHIEIISSSK